MSRIKIEDLSEQSVKTQAPEVAGQAEKAEVVQRRARIESCVGGEPTSLVKWVRG